MKADETHEKMLQLQQLWYFSHLSHGNGAGAFAAGKSTLLNPVPASAALEVQPVATGLAFFCSSAFSKG